MENLVVSPKETGLPISMGFQKSNPEQGDFSTVLSNSLAKSKPGGAKTPGISYNDSAHNKSQVQRGNEQKALRQPSEKRGVSGKEKTMNAETNHKPENNTVVETKDSEIQSVQSVEEQTDQHPLSINDEISAEDILQYFGLTQDEINEVLRSIESSKAEGFVSGEAVLTSMGFAQTDIAKILELYKSDISSGAPLPSLDAADRESILASMFGKSQEPQEILSKTSSEGGGAIKPSIQNGDLIASNAKNSSPNLIPPKQSTEEQGNFSQSKQIPEEAGAFSQVKQTTVGSKEVSQLTEANGEKIIGENGEEISTGKNVLFRKETSLSQDGLQDEADKKDVVMEASEGEPENEELFGIKDLNNLSTMKDAKGMGRIASQEIPNPKDFDSSMAANKLNSIEPPSSIKQADASQMSTNLEKGHFTESTLLEQVTQKAAAFFKSGKDEISIRLNPPSLGNLQIKVQTDANNTVRVSMIAESSMVKGVIESNIGELRQALANQGITADQFSVSVNGGEQFERQERFADDPKEGREYQEKIVDEEEEESKKEFAHLSPASINAESLSIFA